MRLFVSDLHLEDAGAPAFLGFERLLEGAAATASAIYLLGDLTEVWVGDDDDGPLAVALRRVLRAAAARCPVHLMHGNRDFLIGERFAEDTGCSIIPDPHLLDDGTLLSHGDAFCVDDAEYQAVREQLRSPEWQQGVLALSLADRRALAADMRTRSRDSNANKAENIMDVAQREVDRVAAACGARRIIHGHTHRPGVHDHGWGRRYVLGAWERCGWMLRDELDDGAREGELDAAELTCFPLPSGNA